MEDFEQITLKAEDFNRNLTNQRIADLAQYSNLKSCTLYKFNITEQDIETLNSLPKLEYIQFDFCDLTSINLLNFRDDLSGAFFNMCKLKSNQLKDIRAKKLILVDENKKVINIEEFMTIPNVQELHLNNFYIKHIEKVLDVAPNLNYLNIDGSSVENVQALNELTGKLKISNDKFFFKS